MAYFLEGRDFTIKFLTTLIAELGIKQLTDPHLFALAILFAVNEDIMNFELDGFGRGAKETILDVGKKMMTETAKENFSWSSVIEIFEKSGLRQAPGSLEGIMQKKETKEKLKSYIASIIHDALKEEDFRHPDGTFKEVRKRASALPVVGVAAIGLHGLINGMFYSFSYPFRDSKQGEMPFIQWMARHFVGKNLCNHLADRIVDLIYHPSWRITLMQIIDSVWETFEPAAAKRHRLQGNLFPSKTFDASPNFSLSISFGIASCSLKGILPPSLIILPGMRCFGN